MDKVHCIIAGSGIGGLYLARFFKEIGLSCLVLEAGNQIGGRINTLVRQETSFELGAARILSSHHRAMKLLREFSLETIEQNLQDSAIFIHGKWHPSFNALILQYPYKDPVNLFHELILKTGIHSIADFKKMAPVAWDSILTKDWLESQGVPFHYSKLYFLGDADVNMSQISLYESLYFYVTNLADSDGEIYRIKGGMNQIINKLANSIPPPILNEPVKKVKAMSDSLEVSTQNYTFKTNQIIFTCSLNALALVDLPITAREKLNNWLLSGHYGKSLKGILTLKKNLFPEHQYLISDDPIRMLRRSDYEWEFYLPVLHKEWSQEELMMKFKQFFGENLVEEVFIKFYHQPPFNGCYWNYNTGYFHRIFEASKCNKLEKGIFSIGEHFSLNPNWIEGTLESADQFIAEFPA